MCLATAATAVLAALARPAEVGVGTDVAHRGLHRVGLLGPAPFLSPAALRPTVFFHRPTESGGDALGAGGKAPVEGLLQRIGDALRDVVVVVRRARFTPLLPTIVSPLISAFIPALEATRPRLATLLAALPALPALPALRAASRLSLRTRRPALGHGAAMLRTAPPALVELRLTLTLNLTLALALAKTRLWRSQAPDRAHIVLVQLHPDAALETARQND